MAAGVWSILTGSANLKGSGILSDRIRRTVYDLDVHSALTFELYDALLMRDGRGRRSNHQSTMEGIPHILTGIEVHTCWERGGSG